jgi:hypothetical protein
VNTKGEKEKDSTIIVTSFRVISGVDAPVNGDIGDEVHSEDHALGFTSEQSRATIDRKNKDIKAGYLVIFLAGVLH